MQKAVAPNNERNAISMTVWLFDVISLLLQMPLLLFHATGTVFDATQDGFQSVISIIL
jgi:hypothetical protein